MFGNEIITLLETLRKLINLKGELDKRYFENFIEPIWDVFEKVHISYKKSFQEYTDFISNVDAKKDPVRKIDTLLEMIRRDFVYSQDSRSQIVALVENLPSSRFKAKEQNLSTFLIAVQDYFDIQPRSKTSDENERINEEATFFVLSRMLRNEFRQARYRAYSEISQGQDNMTNRIVMTLDRIMQDLQVRYERVAKSYYVIKNDLLS
jgi:hypothetical protein